jgi:hypothetical protein
MFFSFHLVLLSANSCNLQHSNQIQESSLKDEHLGCLKYNGYEGHWCTPNKDPIDLHLDSHICTLQFASLQQLKIYLLHWSTIYVVQNGEWWNHTEDFFELVTIHMNMLDQQSLNVNKAWAWLVKHEHERGPSLNLESQAMIFNIATLEIKNRDPMAFYP